jgi:hypothetical protein
VQRLGRGEKRKSLSSSQSRRSSTSFRLFLVLFTGGGAVSGDKGRVLRLAMVQLVLVQLE